MNSFEKRFNYDRLTLEKFNKTHLTAICDLFKEKDFYFKTFIPNYLSHYEIFNLVENTMVIKLDEKIIGVTEFLESMPAARHYSFLIRISNSVSTDNKVKIIRDIISSYSKTKQVLKLATFYAEFDCEYIRIFNQLEFNIEGSLENLIRQNGTSYSRIYVYKIMGTIPRNNRGRTKKYNRFSKERMN